MSALWPVSEVLLCVCVSGIAGSMHLDMAAKNERLKGLLSSSAEDSDGSLGTLPAYNYDPKANQVRCEDPTRVSLMASSGLTVTFG